MAAPVPVYVPLYELMYREEASGIPSQVSDRSHLNRLKIARYALTFRKKGNNEPHTPTYIPVAVVMTTRRGLPGVWLPVNGNNFNNPEDIFWTDDAILQSSILTNTWEEILLWTKDLGFADDLLKKEALAHGVAVSKSAIPELWAQYKRKCFEFQYPSGEMPVGYTLLLPSKSNRYRPIDSRLLTRGNPAALSRNPLWRFDTVVTRHGKTKIGSTDQS